MNTTVDRAVIEIDAHDGLTNATTIVVAQQLLEHPDIDGQQHPAIRTALIRAALSLAHQVLGDQAPRLLDHPPAPGTPS